MWLHNNGQVKWFVLLCLCIVATYCLAGICVVAECKMAARWVFPANDSQARLLLPEIGQAVAKMGSMLSSTK